MQSENNKMPLTLLCLCATVQCIHTYNNCFLLFMFIHISVLVYTSSCAKITSESVIILHYVNLTYKGMSMRAGLTYKGISCVLYQYT